LQNPGEKEGAYRMLVNNGFDHNDLTEGAIRQLKNVKRPLSLYSRHYRD
jgi:hypothetical protein